MVHGPTAPTPLNPSAGNVRFNDNQKTIFGTGSDALIYYDGTNLIIDPDAVGSGVLTINGDAVVSNGQGLIVGHTSQISIASVSPEFQVLGTGEADATAFIARFANSASQPRLRFLKSRGATIGAFDAVQADDVLGFISASGADGTDDELAVDIIMEADGTVAADQVPGRFRIRTADSSGTITERFRIDSGGIVYVGDGTTTSNANMTVGMTINQGANSDEALAFKRTSVAHALTSIAETDTYGFMKIAATPSGGNGGGLALTGVGHGNTGAFIFQGLSETLVTGKTTSSGGIHTFYSRQHDGAGNVTATGSMTADANLLVIMANNDTTRHIFDIEGTYHGDEAATTFDHVDDLAILQDYRSLAFGEYDEAKVAFLEDVGLFGKGSFRYEDGVPRAMVNNKVRQQIMWSGLAQVWQKQNELEQRLAAIGA